MLSIFVAALAVTALGGAAEPARADGQADRDAAVRRIEQALRGVGQQPAAVRLARLTQAAAEVMRLAPANEFAREILEEALAAADLTPDQAVAVDALAAGLREARGVLAFTPLREAKLPVGFPEPTPLGEIRVQSYPAYRLARAAMAGREGQGRAFFALFEHISRNNIAMTAPVEMTYGAGKRAPEGEAMAFLYEEPRLGRAGADGKVAVVDVPAMTAVSIGVRGDYTAERVADARGRLEAWLARHADRYEAAGPLRVLGYNSPMVPAGRRFAEVQLPVRLKGAAR